MNELNPYGNTAIAPPPGSMLVEAERAVAEIQAMVAVAKRFPRDPKACTDRILQACTRPALAEAALYAYPRGKSTISGPSIRLLECISQNWGNFRQGFNVLSSTKGESLVQAFAWDLEGNVWETKQFVVPHERHTQLGVYKLTDPRDIYEVIANQAQRRKRGCIEALIPGDVLDAAIRQCEVTQNSKEGNPAEQIGKLIKAFAEYGVTQQMIEARLRHNLDATSNPELVDLRRIYRTIRDGIAQAGEYFDLSAKPATKREPDKPRKKPNPKAEESKPAPAESHPSQESDVERSRLMNLVRQWGDDPLDAADNIRKRMFAVMGEPEAHELEALAKRIDEVFGPVN